MTTSSPSVPPSFDPALHLHSDILDLPSESFSDDLEALNIQRIEQTRDKVVIQHRAWNLSDVFRSDDDIRPDTPTKTKSKQFQHIIPSSPARLLPLLPSSPPTVKMPFMSSPAGFPSGPPSPTDPQKRKNDEPPQSSEPKRQKIMGGFLDDEDEDEDQDALDAFGDAQMSQFEIQEQPTVQPTQFPIILGPPQKSPDSTPLANPPVAREPIVESPGPSRKPPGVFQIKTCSGKSHNVASRPSKPAIPYERLVAGRSTTAPGWAQKSYYGIDIHKLLDEAAQESQEKASRPPPPPPAVQRSIESNNMSHKSKKATYAMWTEKYRARKFTDLIGDERTHRWVLRWLKGWDPIVFPNIARSRPKKANIL
ncbi:hypothetical protein DTO013E5_9686 [Penicillium roqueforti]|uniref:Pc23g00440 protein n=4 Tax=Penicillium TaxID=5073 RepID=B6HW98_PENRW|nr:hypothetical protein DTO012A1_10118 [Penicillium roqueforti]KAJ5277718.1 hypothetical protein N7524_003871 [Penicillium chrysogenum]CAP79538.1 Pc23g00440 [Penicillium rubens Wisconsin 54-1255]CDM32791.1 unnamed protein product [Penicillium roqueforti FM164]CRL31512.1 unnamed protein product [Penicillium camemberti]